MKRLRDWWSDTCYYSLPWCWTCWWSGERPCHAPVCHEQGDHEDFLRSLPR